MVIITAVTIVLVIVTGNYAYQVLDRQREASEFDAVKKSFITLDDAIRDVAWDKDGSRSARFTVKYGFLELIPGTDLKGLPLSVTIEEYPEASHSIYTGYIRYNISTNYFTLGNGYKSYLLGDSKTIVSKSAENFGAALIEQKSSWVSLTLCYRVRAMRTSVVQVGGETINYVEISIIKLNATKWSTYIGDLDLAARNMAITTQTYGPFNVAGDNTCTAVVSLGESTDSVDISLDVGKVVFNFVIAEVQLTP
jgi:hypothetical protein